MPLSAPIPPFSMFSHKNGIDHPHLWLWDSWTYSEYGATHLYTLALSRKTEYGTPIRHQNRNNYPFHIRHFKTTDDGQTWNDLGAILSPSRDKDSFYSRNVWSGSVTRLTDNRKIMGFTGIREIGDERPFLQSIGLGLSSDGMAFDSIQEEPLSCPLRDYDQIVRAGYYLGPKSELGHKDGEEGGPILAWRDPYTFVDNSGVIHCFWSAKLSPKVGAIAHATLAENADGFFIEKLHPPIRLPDGDTITQAEVPKIYFDQNKQVYYCLISACDRLYEGQDDKEVSKTLRLYRASDIRGPWYCYKIGTSILTGLDHMFGASIIDLDTVNDKISLVAPITEYAHPDLQLTIAPIQTIAISQKDLENTTIKVEPHTISE